MKKIIATLLISLFVISLQAKDNNFSDFIKQIKTVSGEPKKVIENSKAVILHPLIKDREFITEYISKLSWDKKKPLKTVIDYKVIKGKNIKNKTSVGKSFNFIYIPEILKKVFKVKKVSNWKKSDNLKLDKKRRSGYKFIIKIDNIDKNGQIFLKKNGEIEAISLGFNKDGISHAKNMKESGYIWYFDKKDGKVILKKVVKMTTKKSNNIPTITVTTSTYSQF